MAKSFFFAIFSIGCLIAPALCGRLDAQNNRLELSESSRLIHSPFLSCVLLKSISACSETCSMIGSIYGQPIDSGICGGNDGCMCNTLPNASLEDYWNKKFDGESKNVLGEISNDESLSKNVFGVLKAPFQTFQETISALKPLLKEEQLKNLHPKDQEAQNIFVADDTFKAVEEYIDKNLGSKICEDGNIAKKYLSNVMQKSDGAYFNRIYHEVCRSQNELLIEALNERNKSLSIDAPACFRKQDEGNVIRAIDAAVVNKLIKLPCGKSDSGAKPNKSKNTARSPDAKDVWWKLRGLEKSQVEELEQDKKEWKVDGYYYVSLKNTSSELSLTWHNEKHRVHIVMNNIYDDEITQQWNFPNAFVELSKKKDGAKTQKWAFKYFTYEVTINSKGKIQRGMWEGKEKKNLIKIYKQRINTWCAANDYIVGKDYCIIY